MKYAIIGHGRSPEGKGWGPDIDACDRVVRMWDWHWQKPEDYGVRYDHGVVAMQKRQIKVWRDYNQREPVISWLGYLRSGGPLYAIPDGFDIIDPAGWRTLAFELGGRALGMNLTRGCAAACWAVERLPSGGELALVGFDNFALRMCLPIDAAFSPEYQQEYDKEYPGWRTGSWYQAGAVRCGSHDIAIERPLLETLAKQRGVTVTLWQ